MSMIWIFFELFLTMFDCVYFLSIPAYQLGFQSWVHKSWVICYGLTFVAAITAYNHFTANSFSALYVTLTFTSLFGTIFLRGNWLSKIFWIGFPMALLYGIEILSIKLLTYSKSDITIAVFASYNMYRLKFCVLAKCMQGILLTYLLRTKLQLQKFSYAIMVPAVLLTFFTIFFMSYTQLFGFSSMDRSTVEDMLTVFAAAFLVVNLAYLLLIYLTNRFDKRLETQRNSLNNLLENQLQLLQEKLKTQNREEIIVVYQMLKEFETEVQERLQYFWILAKDHKIAQLNKFAPQMAEVNNLFTKFYQTGNEALDAVFASKAIVANKERIKLQVKVNTVPPEQVISSMHLCTLLINLIDNAIEALKKLVPVDGTDRVIKVAIEIEKNHYKIKIENACVEQDTRSLDELTRVSSRKNTGLGLKVVKQMVDNYGGSLNITQQEFLFTVIILLPLEKYPEDEVFS